eukprot:scaffold9079_cov120-Cylindrotheca_fusiformis.AAC.9
MSRRSNEDKLQRPLLRRRHSMPSLLFRRKTRTAPSPPPQARTKQTKMNQNLRSKGYCSSCGTQLCKYPTTSSLWQLLGMKKKSPERAKPLHIPGKVEDGTCLVCEESNCAPPALPSPPPLKRQTNVAYEQFDQDDSTSGIALKPFSSISFTYEGGYNVYGERHGFGEMIWDDGSRYVGGFFNGLRDGKGTLYLNDGSEYSGDWELNKMHGEGIRYFACKDVFVGRYNRGKRCGQGKMHFANGDLFVGSWKDDKFHGSGRYFIHAQGLALEGDFVQGKKHGKFKVQYRNEDLDIFKFEDDMIVGHGVRWNANRDKTWILTNPKGSDEPWLLGQKINKKRIPIVEAVSIGYTCEDRGLGAPEPLSMMLTLATAIPRVNGRAII